MRRVGFAIVGAIIGVLPGLLLIALVESPVIEGEAELTYGVFGIMIGLVGFVAGAVFGALLGGRSNREQASE